MIDIEHTSGIIDLKILLYITPTLNSLVIYKKLFFLIIEPEYLICTIIVLNNFFVCFKNTDRNKSNGNF